MTDERTSLQHAVDRLVGRVQHWTRHRWAKLSLDGVMTRGDRVHSLAQRLADATADVEGGPHRTVPRLDNDMALSDQLRALTADLLVVDAPPATLEALTAEVRETAAALD